MRFPYFRKRKYLLILKIWRLSQPDFRIVSMEILIMTPSGEVMICDANHLNLWGGANPVWENPRKDLGGGAGGLSFGVGCGDLQCEELVHYLVQYIESWSLRVSRTNFPSHYVECAASVREDHTNVITGRNTCWCVKLTLSTRLSLSDWGT